MNQSVKIGICVKKRKWVQQSGEYDMTLYWWNQCSGNGHYTEGNR